MMDGEKIDECQFFTCTLSIQSPERTQSETLQATDNPTGPTEFLQPTNHRHMRNKLAGHIVESTSVNMFKNRLDDHWNDVGTES